MIRSEIRGRDIQQKERKNWSSIVFRLTVAAAFVAFLDTGSGYRPMTVVLYWPLLGLGAWMIADWIRRKWTRVTQEGDLRWDRLFFYALGLGGLSAVIQRYPTGGTIVPLSLSEVGTYFLTLGILPFASGPDGFLRGLAWGIAIIAGLLIWEESRQGSRAVFVGILVWLLGSAVFLLPGSLIAGFGSFSGGTDGINAFARTVSHAYWNNGQLLRWFVGVGNQMQQTMILFFAAVVLIGSGFAYLISVFVRHWRRVKERIFWKEFAFTALFALGGLYIGWTGRSGSLIDIAVWLLVLCVSTILFVSWIAVPQESLFLDLRKIWLWFSGITIGWPAGLAVLVAWGVGKVREVENESLLRLVFWISIGSMWMWVAQPIGMEWSEGSARILMLGGLCLPVVGWRFVEEGSWKWKMGYWIGSGVLASLFVWSIWPIACVWSGMVTLWVISLMRPYVQRFFAPAVWIVALISLLLVN